MLRSLVGSEMCIRDSPYHALLNKPLNYDESSDTARRLQEANKILKASADYIDRSFDKYKKGHDVALKQPKFPVGCKLFIRTSQRGRIAFKLAKTWSGPYICLKHLDHNNLLVKKIGGRKEEKVHRNNCKPAQFREEYLRLHDFSFPYLTQVTQAPTDELLPALNDPILDPAPDAPVPPVPPEPDPAPAGAADEDVEIESDTSEARSLGSAAEQQGDDDLSDSDDLAGFETPESRSPSPQGAGFRPPIPTPRLSLIHI